MQPPCGSIDIFEASWCHSPRFGQQKAINTSHQKDPPIISSSSLNMPNITTVVACFFLQPFGRIEVLEALQRHRSNLKVASSIPEWQLIWLVVEPTHLQNISQIGSFPQVGVKIKNNWNHQLVVDRFISQQSLMKWRILRKKQECLRKWEGSLEPSVVLRCLETSSPFTGSIPAYQNWKPDFIQKSWGNFAFRRTTQLPVFSPPPPTVPRY